MNCNPKFIKAMAKQYYTLYQKFGYDAAKEYADRMIKDDEELKEAIAKAVGDFFSPSNKR